MKIKMELLPNFNNLQKASFLPFLSSGQTNPLQEPNFPPLFQMCDIGSFNL